jgi:hypothetical protein
MEVEDRSTRRSASPAAQRSPDPAGGAPRSPAAGGAAAASATPPPASPPPASRLPPSGLATREKRSRAGVNSRLADYSVEITHEAAAWADEWTPKRGRWGGRWGRGRGGGGRGGGWRPDVHAENKDRDRCVTWNHLDLTLVIS